MVFGHAFEKTLHCDRGDEPRHLAAEAEVLAGAEAEMALRPAIDVVDIRVGKFPPIAIAGAERKRHFVANVHSSAVQLVSRMTVRLKRCAEVLKRSDSSIAGSISAGFATRRRRASG